MNKNSEGRLTAARMQSSLLGWMPTPDALAIQERVIRGELTHDEAVQAHIESARNAHAKRGQ